MLTTNEAHKERVKNQYDKAIKPSIFSEWELVLVYDQDKEPLGARKFKLMWLGSYVVSKFLKKVSYELIDYEDSKLPKSQNRLYLRKYYS